MDRTSGFGRLAQLGVMTMSSGAGVATALAQELYGGGAAHLRPPSAEAEGAGQVRPVARKAETPARVGRCGNVPCPGRVA